MDFSEPRVIWVCLGVILMLAELIVPGGIVVFLGAAGVLVAGALQFGLVDGWVQSLTLWFVLSLVLLLAFRGVTQKLVGGEQRVDDTDEEMAIYQKTARVVETIGPGQHQGRVSFQDSTWPALGNGEQIESGSLVRIICHDNIALVVEPLAAAELEISNKRTV